MSEESDRLPGIPRATIEFWWEARWLWVVTLGMALSFAAAITYIDPPWVYSVILGIGYISGHLSMKTSPKFEIEARY